MIRFLKAIFRLKSIGIIITIGICLGLLLSYLAPYVAPSSSRFIPIFGLAYAPLIVGLFAMLIIWLVVRSKWYIPLLITLLLGIHVHFDYFTFGSESTFTSEKPQLHMMSYNVRGFGIFNQEEENFSEQFKRVEKYIADANPDVLCIQEFFDGKPVNRINTLTAIENALSVNKNSQLTFTNIHRRFGIITISKYPIIRERTVSLNGNVSRCIYTDIKKGLDTIRVFNVHFQSIKLVDKDLDVTQEGRSLEDQSLTVIRKLNLAYQIREKQIKDLADKIEESPYHTIVCGDFNDTPISYSYHSINNLLTDNWKSTSKGIGTTYAGKLPVGRIDYIFSSSELKPLKFKIQEKALSDHYAIESFLELN